MTSFPGAYGPSVKSREPPPDYSFMENGPEWPVDDLYRKFTEAVKCVLDRIPQKQREIWKHKQVFLQGAFEDECRTIIYESVVHKESIWQETEDPRHLTDREICYLLVHPELFSSGQRRRRKKNNELAIAYRYKGSEDIYLIIAVSGFGEWNSRLCEVLGGLMRMKTSKKKIDRSDD